MALTLNGCNASIHPFRVAGNAMLPLLSAGDKIFVDESENARSNIHDGDVVVFRHNGLVTVKRVLATQGQTISSDHRKVFRDGKELSEPYRAAAQGDGIASLNTFPPRKIAAGEIFVVGDNRDRSADSRLVNYGPVRVSDVIGKYIWTYWHASK